MDPRFAAIDEDAVLKLDQGALEAADFNANVTAPWNQIFKIVFFPDRIYHAQYLNATRGPRYRIMCWRSADADFTILN
jgi:hypothetical protein